MPVPVVTEPAIQTEVPEGIRRARAAFLRDFERLHADRKIRGKYAAYHLENMVAVGADYFSLIRDMYARGISDAEWVVIKVTPGSQIDEQACANEAEINPD